MSFQDDFFRATAESMMGMQEVMSNLIRSDRDGNVAPGEGAFASLVGPPAVDAERRRRVRALPAANSESPNAVWYVHTHAEREDEGTSYICQIFQVAKERGSNGLPFPESDGLGMNLAMCSILDPCDEMASRARLLRGTIVKACLEPGGPMGGMGMPRTFGPAVAAAFDILPSRPRKVLFQTRGEREMLAPSLQKMGIKKTAVAEPNLVRSLELYSSAMNDAQDAHVAAGVDPFGASPQDMGRSILAHGRAMEEPYVEEPDEPYNLGGWRPPSDVKFPAHWFALRPDNPDSYRATALLGWRTNLERAILREDGERVETIVQQRDTGDVREFVECRMLLTKCAQRGLVVACRLLTEECGASVEGAQAPDAPSWWRPVQNYSGNCESLTPLHQASRNGQVEAVELLLSKGAEIDRVDKSKIRGTALHHAVSGGQVGCCRVLCKHGASHTYEGSGGEALDISQLCAEGDRFRARQQEKIQQVLRKYDARCSYCRDPYPTKNCPCRKEKYCNADCQKARWKEHKKFHKEIVGSKG